MKNHLFGIVIIMATFSTTDAQSPIYNLDSIGNHPFRFVPYFGHASQNPGSPKYFVPGYGYQIPGFGAGASAMYAPGGYRPLNAFGRRDYAAFNDEDYMYWTNSLGGPWYHPGWRGNVRLRTQAW